MAAVSKRQQKRLDAAEHVCRALISFIYREDEGYYMRVAQDWLIVWMDNAPNVVKFATPTPPPKKRANV